MVCIRKSFRLIYSDIDFLETNVESIALNRSQSSQDDPTDPNDDADDAFKPSTLRRSFRRMRKAVKWAKCCQYLIQNIGLP